MGTYTNETHVLISRELLKDTILMHDKKGVSRGNAYLYLLLKCDNGVFITDYFHLSNFLGWGKSKVKKFLKDLELTGRAKTSIFQTTDRHYKDIKIELCDYVALKEERN